MQPNPILFKIPNLPARLESSKPAITCAASQKAAASAKRVLETPLPEPKRLKTQAPNDSFEGCGTKSWNFKYFDVKLEGYFTKGKIDEKRPFKYTLLLNDSTQMPIKSFSKRIVTLLNDDVLTEQNGQAVLTSPKGVKYIGSLKGLLPHGLGSMTYKKDDSYEGEFKGGLPWGRGKRVYPNGKTYLGQFVEGVPHGDGILSERVTMVKGVVQLVT